MGEGNIVFSKPKAPLMGDFGLEPLPEQAVKAKVGDFNKGKELYAKGATITEAARESGLDFANLYHRLKREGLTRVKVVLTREEAHYLLGVLGKETPLVAGRLRVKIKEALGVP